MSVSTQKIVIVDTKCANLASVNYALKRLGVIAEISDQIDVINSADRLFLPGVGSANAVMQNIYNLKLKDCLTNFDRPLLGICLGMQILGEFSEEGNVDLLKITNQKVIKLPITDLPLPHMGWNQVSFQADNPLFKGINQNSYFYFVHSYCMATNATTIATSNYAYEFSAAIQKNNFYGVQFHPERSGEVGAKLLQNFLEL